ncbi:MAG TPA: TetR family transcriptional regulator [Solirubrobacteraceae bacterium]|nr:TetR family transcriptional regulator [Solirubrobacteraceae bacterium]
MAGLRERKKRETAERIALAAAELFAEHGFEAVAVVDVARVADVSEQTVYNHFPTKEDLVFDRSAEIEDALADAVADRPPGVAAVDAVGDVARAIIERTSVIGLDRSRGGMPRLSAASPTLGRAALERTRRQAGRLADVLTGQGEGPAEAAVVAWALVGVMALLIEELGQAQQAGEDPALTAQRLRELVDRRVERLRRLSS